MQLLPTTVIGVGVMAGLSGAVVAYQASAAPEAIVSRPLQAPQATPSTQVTWLPCDPGFRLSGTSCVRTVERSVRAAAPVRRSAPGTTAPGARVDSTDDHDDHDEDHDEDHDDDGSGHGRDGDDDGDRSGHGGDDRDDRDEDHSGHGRDGDDD